MQLATQEGLLAQQQASRVAEPLLLQHSISPHPALTPSPPALP